MSALQQILNQTWHRLNPDFAALAGVTVSDLQQFAAGHISISEQALRTLTWVIWNGKKKYAGATDNLVEI